MDQGRYIWCRVCNEVHHVTPFDRSPMYVSQPRGDRVVPMDDWREFMQRHAGHKLEALRAFGERQVQDRPSMDPMKERYIDVTNGQECFVIRSFRTSIEEPLDFELLTGRLKITRVSVEIQENEIRKEMNYHFPWEPSASLVNEKIDLFIRLFKELVRDLDSSLINVPGYSYTNNSVVYGSLDARFIEFLMERCEPYFSTAELKGIKKFCEFHMGSDGVMGLLIKHAFGIEKSV